MSMFKDESVRKGVIASIIASIVFFIFLEPLLRFFWNFLNRFSSVIYNGYLDTIYQSAALGQRNDLDFVIFSTLNILILAGLVMVTFYIKSRKDQRDFHKKILKIKNDEERNMEIKRINELHEKIRFFDKIQSVSEKIIVQGRYFTFVLFFIVGFILIFRSYSDLQLNTKFNQQLRALSPYIDDSQEKILISKWALMKSKKDYLEINVIIENIAKQNNIELPKTLI